MDNFAVWFMNGHAMEAPRDRDLAHLRALHEARAAAVRTARPSRLERLAASVRATFRTEATNQPDAACCAA